MRKTLSLILAAALFILSTACAPEQDRSTDAPGGTSALSESAAGPAASGNSSEPVTLNWLHRYPEERYVEYFQGLADGFMRENPNITINVEVVGDIAMKDKLKVMMGGGDIPDIFYSWPGEFAGQFARNGAALDLTPYIEADQEWKASIGDVFWDYVDMYDMHVGVPFRLSISTLQYNQAIFDECGVEVPKTFSELKVASNILREKGYIPIAFGANPPWPPTHYFTNLIPQYVGVETFKKDANPAEGTWDNPGYVKAIEAFQDLIASGCFNDNINSLSYDQATLIYYEKQAAMLMGGSMAMTKAAEELGDENSKWMPFPVADDAAGDLDTVTGGCDLFLISAKTQHPDEAVAFLKYMTRKDNQIELTKQTGLQPVANDTINEETAHFTVVEFMDYTLNESGGIVTWLDTICESRVKDKWLDNMQLIIDGKDAGQVMAEIQEVAAIVRAEYQ